MTLSVLLRSPFMLWSWLTAVARSLCVLVRSVFTPPTSLCTVETWLETALHLLRGLLLGVLKALVLGFLALNNRLRPLLQFLLREATDLAQLVGSDLQAGIGFRAALQQFWVFCCLASANSACAVVSRLPSVKHQMRLPMAASRATAIAANRAPEVSSGAIFNFTHSLPFLDRPVLSSQPRLAQ